MNKKLLNLNELDKKFVYIDGSVVFSGTENVAGLSGINVYDGNHNLIDEIYINIENWIFPLKSELFAFVIALLITHNINNVMVITDSEILFN